MAGMPAIASDPSRFPREGGFDFAEEVGGVTQAAGHPFAADLIGDLQ
jgi:hypothetical protein